MTGYTACGLLPVPGKNTIKSLEKMIVYMEKETRLLEPKIESLSEQWH